LNVYQKQGIEDPVEIEKYKKELIELDEMGYKAMKKNLIILAQNREGDDFTVAKKKVIEFQDTLKRKRKLKKEQKRSKKNLKKKEKNGMDINYEGDDMKCEDEIENTYSESSKYEEIYHSFVNFEDWPENTFSYIFIDGNNCLYIPKNVRNLTIKRNNKGQNILIGAFEMFSSLVTGLEEVVIIFDFISTVYDKVLENNTKFIIGSAKPNYPTADDALVAEAEKYDLEKRKRSLYITSDKGLCSRLVAQGVAVMKPKQFLSIVMRKIYGKDHNIQLDEWFLDIEHKIDELRDNSKDLNLE